MDTNLLKVSHFASFEASLIKIGHNVNSSLLFNIHFEF